MRVLINRHVVQGPWGGGNHFVRAFRAEMAALGHNDVWRLDDVPDVVVLVGTDADGMGVSAEHAVQHRLANPSCLLVFRINECDARKGTDHVDLTLLRVSRCCDLLVFVSTWLRDHLFDRWRSLLSMYGDKTTHLTELRARSVVVHNGVDRTVFVPTAASTAPKPGGPIRVAAHHWSDNPMKGRNVYEALDAVPEIKLTYIGRHRCRFTSKDTVVIPPLAGHELAMALAGNDAYVSGSLWDPGPNHVLEALSCGLPTWVHRDGGGCVEFAGTDHSYVTVNELITLLTGPSACARNTYMPVGWDQCIAQYVEAIEEARKKVM